MVEKQVMREPPLELRTLPALPALPRSTDLTAEGVRWDGIVGEAFAQLGYNLAACRSTHGELVDWIYKTREDIDRANPN